MATNEAKSKSLIDIISKPETICSCHECDSISCFAKRHGSEPCFCQQCIKSKTCLFYSNENVCFNDSWSYSSKITQATSAGEYSDGYIAKETVESEIFSDQDINLNSKNLSVHSNRIIQDIYKDYSVSSLIDNSAIQGDDIPVTNTYSRKELNAPIAKLSAQIMDLPYNEFTGSISYKKTNISAYKQNKISKYDIFKRLKEVYKACSCKVCECIVGRSLSIKNDVCTCIPCNCKECTKYTSNPQRTDINKVIVKESIRCINNNCCKAFAHNDESKHCDCKPCDCVECAFHNSFSKTTCDCKVCQCVECKSSSLRTQKTLIIAPVGEDNQRNLCDCEPCQCIQCVEGVSNAYGMSSSLMHEMSTGLNRHQNCHCEACVDESCVPDSNDTCKCERRNRVMRKPVQKDNHDYDIRPAMIGNEVLRNMYEGTKEACHDTIAMFAALNNTYPKFTYYMKKPCDCDECECIVSHCEEKTATSIKSSQLFHTAKVFPNVSKRCFMSCKCSPCECQICASQKRKMSSERLIKRICKCDVCDCLNCDGLTRSANNETYVSSRCSIFLHANVCKCNPCECRNCELDKCLEGNEFYNKNINNRYYQCAEAISSEILYPVKRGVLLTPAMFEDKISRQKKNIDNYTNFKSTSIIKPSKNHSSGLTFNSKIDHSLYHVKSQHSINSSKTDYVKVQKPVVNTTKGHVKFSKNNLETEKNPKNSETMLCDTYTGSQDVYNIGPFNHNIKQQRDNYNNSSFHALPKATHFQESKIPLSSSKQEYTFESRESSCNSSGYDSPNYLIKFPKTTVENCVDDVLKLDFNESLKLNHSYGPRISNGTCSGAVDEGYMQSLNTNNWAENKKNVTSITFDAVNEISKQKHHSNLNIIDHFKENDYLLNDNSQHKDGENYIERTKDHWRADSIHTRPDQLLVGTYPTLKNENILYKTLNKLNHLEISRKFNRDLHFFNYYSTLNMNVIDALRKDEDSNCIYANQFLPGHVQNAFDVVIINYEKIRKTLQEAKAFTQYLANILEKYEKENKEFVSVSEKLKDAHYMLINGIHKSTTDIVLLERPDLTPNDDTNDNVILNNVDIVIQNNHSDIYESPVKDINETCNILEKGHNLVQVECVKTAGQNYVENERRADSAKNLNEESPNLKKKNVTQQNDSNIEKEKTLTNTGDIIVGGLKYPQEQQMKIEEKSEGKTGEVLEINYEKLCGTLYVCERESNEISIRQRENTIQKSYAQYGKRMNRNVMDLKKVRTAASCSKPKLKVGVATETSKNITPASHDIIKKPIQTSESLEEIQKQILFNKEDPWPIFKKHCNILHTKPMRRNKGVCVFPTLDTEVKEAVLAISLQTSTNTVDITSPPIGHRENKALAKLQIEVQKLLNMPILQTTKNDNGNSNLQHKNNLTLETKDVPLSGFRHNEEMLKDKTLYESSNASTLGSEKNNKDGPNILIQNIQQRQMEELLNLSNLYPAAKRCYEKNDADCSVATDVQIPNVGSVKSSCEAQKVSFLSVRRVSDHTVVVKWNIPKIMANVQGYELQVDGRAVQKLINPLKCMAVVTCLPHTDKVLLTIRTILSTMKPSGHFPTSTIVYRPRDR